MKELTFEEISQQIGTFKSLIPRMTDLALKEIVGYANKELLRRDYANERIDRRSYPLVHAD